MHTQQTFSGKSVIIRLELNTELVNFSQIATVIHLAGGDIVAMDSIYTSPKETVRDVTVSLADNADMDQLTSIIDQVPGVKLVHVSDRTFLLHLGGKIEVKLKTPIHNREDLSRVYTPDVARVCMAIYEDEDKAHTLTIRKNMVAVVSDGSAVLGLGNIGPKAAMPVMEGKAMLFKQMADVDAFPICLDTQDTEEIIRTVKAIAPTFGGINLEDISSPRCFEIEERLRAELDIPVFHDDQHGTAVVAYAGLINALKVAGKKIEDVRVVICGVGAAGVACGKMLLAAGVKDILGIDRDGIVSEHRTYPSTIKQWFAKNTNKEQRQGSLQDALAGADVVFGLSSGGLIKSDDLKTMAPNPIVFAMANPNPEILPEDAEGLVAVIATGRSDYPNQINNVLCFPGIFRGALDCRATTINEEMKLAAAEAIAAVITDQERNRLFIIPSVFNQEVVKSVRNRVIEAAIATGVARKIPRDFRNMAPEVIQHP